MPGRGREHCSSTLAGHREHAANTDVRIIDLSTPDILLRMRDKRQRGHRAMGYRITELRLAQPESKDF
jgi:hypothetical protein